MKKILAITLTTSLLLGSTPMQADYKLKKAWAYTKNGLGIISIIDTGRYPWIRAHIGPKVQKLEDEELEMVGKATKNAQDIAEFADSHWPWQNKRKKKELKTRREQAKKNIHNLFDNGLRTAYLKGLTKVPIVSPIMTLSLGSLLIQSGRRNLRRIKKLEAKEKTQPETSG